MGINDAIIIVDTRLIVQVGLDVNAALMIGDVSLLCHHNNLKVINNIIANLCVCVCACVRVWNLMGQA